MADQDSLCQDAWYTVILHNIFSRPFADDLALLSHRVQDLREQGEKVGLEINTTKKRMICIYTKHSDGVFIEGEQVKEVDKFTYLGNIASKKGGTNEDIQACTGNAR